MKIRLLIAAILAITTLGGQAARAGIVFDSLTGANSIGLEPIAPSTGPLGDSFSTGTSAASLSDVKVNLYNPAVSTTGSVTVSLYASNGLYPTTFLDTLGTVSTSTVTPGAFLTADFSNFGAVYLSANTRYYIILSTSNSSPLDAVVTNTLSGPEVGTEFTYFNGMTQANAARNSLTSME